MRKRETTVQHDVAIRQDATEMHVLSVDQRAAERLPLTLTLSYTIRSGDEQITGSSKTMTISGAGIEFSISQMIAVASPCQIVLAMLDRPEPLMLFGQIGWCRQKRGGKDYAVGVTFSPARNETTFAQYCHFVAAELLKRYLQ
ncbi:MAG: PilZ domain-containing protein [Candidatus Omnitrophica bacterium]|nr:PilZ domain-containing protein [Candidatus Omnitrophota bacterium]